MPFKTTGAAGRPVSPAQRSPASHQRTAAGQAVAAYSYDLVRQYSRPADAFTQGLVFYRGRLYEGTGLYGESRLRETVLQDGTQKVMRERLLPDDLTLSPEQRRYQVNRLVDYGYSRGDAARRQDRTVLFGEGITILAGRVYQLTWVEGICLVWDIGNWNTPARVFHYTGEGWGLTHDGKLLIMSDGSASLRFRNPDSFAVVKTIEVKDPRSGTPVGSLNELEYINGRIFANVYGTRRVAIIDPATGFLQGYLLLDGRRELPGTGAPSLLPQAQWDVLDARWEVLNGIAFDAESGHLFVTGKKWPEIFEIVLRKVADRM